MSKPMKEELKKELKERISILCVAYHNLGVQQEFLKMLTEALESYKLACMFSAKYFGEANAIYQNMKSVYDKAKQALETQVARQFEKANKVANKEKAGVMAMTESRQRAVSAARSSKSGLIGSKGRRNMAYVAT